MHKQIIFLISLNVKDNILIKVKVFKKDQRENNLTLLAFIVCSILARDFLDAGQLDDYQGSQVDE